ncbi:DUF3883 domain-containing protein [Maribacter sp. 2308TA10-17]|uniref:DUF3883 domain-containing protein n=1 Tax=Maribacter sp. 2308TA10-17 TaxID=3386276 RepID=UPI0039BD2340
MNIHDLRIAQVHFESQIDNVLESRKELYKLRDNFSKYFSPARISSMPIDHYAIGNDLPKKGYNFCYTIERELDGLGRIIGATSFKFGVYYGRTKSEPEYKYRFTKKFGNNSTEAYLNVKAQILKLLEAGRNENIEEIVRNKISPMFKGKILCTYFPQRYLNVFSDEHLEYFLVQLNIDTQDLVRSDAVIKREALIRFKNSDEVMKTWSTDLFSYFLYRVYPGRPPKENSNLKNPLEGYKNPDFPVDPSPEWIDMSIEPPKKVNPDRKPRKEKKNPDYEKEARKLKRLGDRGEKLVLDMEKHRLEELGFTKLSKNVSKAKYDYLGYDIKSFEENGDERYIEVKATSSKVGAANFFLSVNEFQKAQELNNYFVYVVFDILSANPQVWIIGNPFKPENKKVKMTPISYRVEINAKKK